MSPNNIPPATSTIPPKISKRRALMGPKIGTAVDDIALLAMFYGCFSYIHKVLVHRCLCCCCSEDGNHVLREHRLCRCSSSDPDHFEYLTTLMKRLLSLSSAKISSDGDWSKAFRPPQSYHVKRSAS